MTHLKTLALAVGLTASPMIAQVQQNLQPQTQPSQAASAACDDAAKPSTTNAAQNEASRVGARIFTKALKTWVPRGVRGGDAPIQPSDISQVAAEAAAQKAREKQEHERYCAALKEAAKKASTPPPTTKVIEACPPSSTRAVGTPYCLKSDNTLVDLVHISVPVNPLAPTTLTPALPASAVPATAQR